MSSLLFVTCQSAEIEPLVEPSATTPAASRSSLPQAVSNIPTTCGVPETDAVRDARAAAAAGNGLTRDDLEDSSLLKMQLVEVTDAIARDAVCNDGSAAGFYYRAGEGDGRNRWVIHLEGGGFCFDEASCRERQIGSAGRMTAPTTRQLRNGIQSPLLVENPDFYNNNHIYVSYCSSDLWSGDREASEATDGLHFRGRRILEAVLDDLDAGVGDLPSLSSADAVLLVGGSAGGFGVLATLDDVAARYSETQVCGLNDAGWMADLDLYNGAGVSVADNLSDGAQLWQAAVDDDCANAHPDSIGDCLLAGTVAPHLTTPIFLNTSQKDGTLLTFLGAESPYDDGESAYVALFANNVLQSVALYPAAFSADRAGHGMTARDRFWLVDIDGVLLRDVVGNWYFDREGPQRLIEGAE